MQDEYRIIPVDGEMIGGHYAVQGPDGRIVGKEFRLDRTLALVLSKELIHAHNLGASRERA